uniref:Polyphenol oxidase, chloroplastic n=1 Tax=Spinacia oleracea TaxID=3562 RepID=PPO_SPIOL|nr:RecName: Full=Polyphenol oxidase, chloroplastic; Short=PPO; AltName: Full=Catechol oxidase; Flags: Precursor [Spinacia oleracea]AAC49041.1 polyphenol oxidase precursor [Spinacia oleracea]CAA91448.1 polyphenol oxidase [Spinacia oleracea]
MATLSSPTIITTTSILLNNPFLPKTPQLSAHHHRGVRSVNGKVSCQTKNNNGNDENNQFQLIQNPNTNTPYLLDRRNILLGLGGMYAALGSEGANYYNTLAAPILPDVEKCTLSDALWDGSVGDHCCPPPFDLNITKDFEFKNYHNHVKKVRRPAHKAYEDQEWLNDYKRAIAIMKSLPMSDPRSHMQQARVHCAYCDGSYPVLGHNDTRLEVHASWLFPSFHRWYLYFYERILGKLINKPDFALPYWNWDHRDGMRIPEIFKEMDSPLFDPNRNTNHLDKMMNLSFVSDEEGSDVNEDDQYEENILLMRKAMVYPSVSDDPNKAELFLGSPYRAGDKMEGDVSGAGILERMPHNSVHVWTRSNTIKGNQDMGAFWSAGRDPLFYCHHSNVDRMWSLWTDVLHGGNFPKTPEYDDYRNAYFYFYDENANPVRVYVRDSFDTERLGYKYEDQELPWMSITQQQQQQQRQQQRQPLLGGRLKTRTFSLVKKVLTELKVMLPLPLKYSVIKTKVDRPKKSRTKEDKLEHEEVLVINFKLGKSKDFIKFDVYINDGTDYKPEDKTKINLEYAGSFTSLTHGGGGGGGDMSHMAEEDMGKNTVLKLALNQLLEDLDATDDDSIQVTIVPKSGTDSIVITGIDIE